MDLLIILKKQSMLILAPKFHHIFSYISLCYIEWIILICTMYNATKQFTVEWEQRPSRPVEQRYLFPFKTKRSKVLLCVVAYTCIPAIFGGRILEQCGIATY